eukprot:XP_001708650.1 Hypothetical protein GL50803_34259 [Giardia lamblia ATCC 50803]
MGCLHPCERHLRHGKELLAKNVTDGIVLVRYLELQSVRSADFVHLQELCAPAVWYECFVPIRDIVHCDTAARRRRKLC